MRSKIALFILLIGSVICLVGCKGNITQHTIILYDQNEKGFTCINFEEWKAGSALTENKNNGEQLRINLITDVGFTKPINLSIDAVPIPLLGNDYNRKTEINTYYENVRQVFNSMGIEKSGKANSFVFKSISEALNTLAVSHSDKKQLIVTSDLRENSPLYSFHNQEMLSILKKSPDSVKNIFLTKYPLMDLSGIVVFLYYEPVDYSDSDVFEIIADFYVSILTSHNATVYINEPFKTN